MHVSVLERMSLIDYITLWDEATLWNLKLGALCSPATPTVAYQLPGKLPRGQDGTSLG